MILRNQTSGNEKTYLHSQSLFEYSYPSWREDPSIYLCGRFFVHFTDFCFFKFAIPSTSFTKNRRTACWSACAAMTAFLGCWGSSREKSPLALPTSRIFLYARSINSSLNHKPSRKNIFISRILIICSPHWITGSISLSEFCTSERLYFHYNLIANSDLHLNSEPLTPAI